MDENTSVEIVGLSDKPITVDSAGNVSQVAAVGEPDVMADMRAAVAVDAPQDVIADMKAAVGDLGSADTPKEPIAEGAPAERDKPAPAEEKPLDALPAPQSDDNETAEEKPSDDSEADKPKEPAEEEKPAEKKEGAEDKTADEETKTKEQDNEPEAAAEPSETEKLVDDLGGIEVLKAAQPLIEAVYDPSLPVSERVARLEAFVPEAQMKDLRNEIFWQAVENPEIHELLASDDEAREVYAQKVFGVPFGYLEQIVNEHKEFFSEDDFTQALEDYKQEHPAPVAKKTDEKSAVAAARPTEEKPNQAKKEESKTEEKNEDQKPLAPAFVSILDNLSNDVDAIYSTAKLEPSDKDDAETQRLKADAAKQFEEEWPKAFMADEAAMKAYRAVKGLVDQGAETQAQQKYASLSKNAKRIAADLLQRVTAPLDAHRTATKTKAKAVVAAHIEKPTGANQPQIDSAPKGAGVDITNLRNDADITRAMEEAIERNLKKG
jgi:hypothetical protein